MSPLYNAVKVDPTSDLTHRMLYGADPADLMKAPSPSPDPEPNPTSTPNPNPPLLNPTNVFKDHRFMGP